MLPIVQEMLLESANRVVEIKGFQGDFRWLSNFYPVEPFEYDGLCYKTVENFYVAMKTLNKNDRRLIAENLEPNQAKRYGSYHNKNFECREDWDAIKLDVMEYALRIKFSQPRFQELLLATRHVYIEETNNWGDVFWGCLPSGEGSNHLGLIIMKLRTELHTHGKLLDFKPERKSVAVKKKSHQP